MNNNIKPFTLYEFRDIVLKKYKKKSNNLSHLIRRTHNDSQLPNNIKPYTLDEFKDVVNDLGKKTN